MILLWLGYPRRDGDRYDWYAVFTGLVLRGELPEDSVASPDQAAEPQSNTQIGASACPLPDAMCNQQRPLNLPRLVQRCYPPSG
jgi:hypothetical protein